MMHHYKLTIALLVGAVASQLPEKDPWPMPTGPNQHCNYTYDRMFQKDTHEVYAAYYGQSEKKFEDWTMPAD